MIYPDNFEHKIGFDEIKSLLSQHCQSELGRERVSQLEMLTDADKITQRQQETRELTCILEGSTEIPHTH